MLRLAVNVSPRQFQQKTLPQLLHTILDETGLPAHCMELEITEGMLMQSPEESTEVLRALRRLGIAIVVDDFGTGYSSLAYLTRFPIDKIKIDRPLVRDIHNDAPDAAAVTSILPMARPERESAG